MRSLPRVGLGLVLASVCFSLVFAGGLPEKPSQPQEKIQAEQVVEEVDVVEVQETTIIEEAATWIGAESVWSFRNRMPRAKIYLRVEPSEDRYYLIGISKIEDIESQLFDNDGAFQRSKFIQNLITHGIGDRSQLENFLEMMMKLSKQFKVYGEDDGK